MIEQRVCECGNLLPSDKEGCKRHRRYCDECRRVRHNEVALKYFRRRKDKLSNTTVVVCRNPMLRLGIDYVRLKLAGLIRIPKEGKQIVLTTGDKYYGESW